MFNGGDSFGASAGNNMGSTESSVACIDIDPQYVPSWKFGVYPVQDRL
jgi:hypothetical protein